MWGCLGATAGLAAIGYALYPEYRPACHYGLTCADPRAEKGRPCRFYDGYLIGAGAGAYNPSAYQLTDLPPVLPWSGTADHPMICYINGANHRIDLAWIEMIALAEKARAPVTGIYAASLGGRFFDAWWGFRPGRKVPGVVVEQLRQAIASDSRLHFRANSQGAWFLRRGLMQAQDALGRCALERLDVETAGAAAHLWPDGPRYVHYINTKDPIPHRVGVVRTDAIPGAGAVVVEFNASDNEPLEALYWRVGPLTRRYYLSVHGARVYLEHRGDFEAIYHAFSKPGKVRRVPFSEIAASLQT